MRTLAAFISFLLIVITYSCNNAGVSNSNGNRADTGKVKVVSRTSTPMERLLSHFNETNKFPLVVDSVYIANIDKTDSLGTNELKMLAAHWLEDSLIDGIDYTMKNFYTIDSAKAKHAFDKWAEKLDIGMMKFANAYGLKSIKLDDSTNLLIWALHCSSYEADPFFVFTDIYFTIVYNGTIGKTFLLGEDYAGGDPPSMGNTRINGTLYKDGKLALDWTNLIVDIDSDSGELSHVQYEYAIKSGQIIKKAEKMDDVKELKVKSE